MPTNNTFYSSIEEELSNLKDQLWSQWDQLLDNKQNSDNNEIDNETLCLINKDVLTFESLIETLIVAFNQSNNSSLTLSWVRSQSFRNNDKLSLVKDGLNSNDVMVYDDDIMNSNNFNRLNLEDSYFDILSHINWLHGYRLQLNETILLINEGKLNRINRIRNETIEPNPMDDDPHYKNSQEPEYVLDTKEQSTRDKLLNKTQQLTNSLIKSNTLLQSSILQSDLNLDDLKQQTQSLNQIQDKYSQLETIFNKTNELVKSLEMASNQEKRDVYISLGVLALAISWVIWRRIFKGPTKLFLWLLFKFFKGILVSIGVVQRITINNSNSNNNIPTISNTITTGSSITTATDITASLEQAVDDAFSRILLHDEL